MLENKISTLNMCGERLAGIKTVPTAVKEEYSAVLLVHGSKDEKTPVSEMESFYNAANKPKEKIVLDGAGHNLKPCRDEMYDVVKQWFMKYLHKK